MATNHERPSTPTIKTHRSGANTLKRSTSYNFRVQSAPPLSIRHYLRSASGVLRGVPDWKPSGKYCAPTFRAYLDPERRKVEKKVEPVWHPPGLYRDKPPRPLSPETIKPKPVHEPVWHPPGPYRDKPPRPLSPETIKPKPVHEPVWNPAGKPQRKAVPYFDPPSLRWSYQELLRSMPELRPKTFHVSKSMSALRKSETIQET